MKIREWYLIKNKCNDYGEGLVEIICCENKKEVNLIKKYAYYYTKIDESEAENLGKYLDNTKTFLTSRQNLEQYLELYY